MTITVDATFENGQLKLSQPVKLAEGTPVRLTITPVEHDYDPLDAVIGICTGGPRDGAQNHDKYIYGPMVQSSPTPAKRAPKRHK